MGRLFIVFVAALLLRPAPVDECTLYCSECEHDCIEGCEQRCRGDCSDACARTCARGCRRCVEFCRAWLRPQRGEPASRSGTRSRRGERAR